MYYQKDYSRKHHPCNQIHYFREDFPENKRKLLFKFYKHLKYVVINEENGVIDNFPLEDPKHISEVDPVNEITLKRNYTNLNIARTLKNKILNSVLKHTKRARKIMLEWQTNKELEKNREKEIVNKIEEENENKIEEEKIENNTKNLKSLEIKNIPNFPSF